MNTTSIILVTTPCYSNCDLDPASLLVAIVIIVLVYLLLKHNMKIQIYALIDKDAATVNNDSVWCLCADQEDLAQARIAYSEPIYETDTTAKWVTCEAPIKDLVAGLLCMTHNSTFPIDYPIISVL